MSCKIIHRSFVFQSTINSFTSSDFLTSYYLNIQSDMQSTLNDQFISEYCKRFTKAIITSVGTDKSSVTGKELIDLTPSKQVNFFILKSLYERWQDEMRKLESPYFNYKHEEVRQALTNYMNVLSQHIEVKVQDLEPLVAEAIEQAIYWILSPIDSLKEQVNKKGIKQVSGLKVHTRYFKVYNDDLKYLITQKPEETIEDFLMEWDELMNQKSVDSIIEKELAALNEVEAVSQEQCLLQDKDPEDEIVEEEIEADSEPDIDLVDDTNDREDSDMDEDTDDIEETFDENDLDSDDDDADLEAGLGHSEDEEEQMVDSEDSLNRKFEKSQETLHDKYKEEQLSVAIKHQQKKIGSILEAVSVNQEYMFTTELFGGEKEVFHEAIEKIESCSSFDESVESLVSTYASKYDWNMNSVEVKELLKVVFRRFR